MFTLTVFIVSTVPLPDITITVFTLVIYHFCVEVFEKTISRKELIDHSFESKFYGVCYRLCKNVLRGFSCALRAHKFLKWDFCYDAVYQSL